MREEAFELELAATRAKIEVQTVLRGSPPSRKRTLAPWIDEVPPQQQQKKEPQLDRFDVMGTKGLRIVDIFDGVDHYGSGYNSRSVMEASDHTSPAGSSSRADALEKALEVKERELKESRQQVAEGKALQQKLLGIVGEQAERIGENKRNAREALEAREAEWEQERAELEAKIRTLSSTEANGIDNIENRPDVSTDGAHAGGQP